MIRRVFVVLVLAFALAPLASAAETVERLRAALETADHLGEIFPAAATVRVTRAPDGMVTIEPPAPIVVLVARVNADGTISTACAGTEQAARDFMSGKTKPAGAEKE